MRSVWLVLTVYYGQNRMDLVVIYLHVSASGYIDCLIGCLNLLRINYLARLYPPSSQQSFLSIYTIGVLLCPFKVFELSLFQITSVG